MVSEATDEEADEEQLEDAGAQSQASYIRRPQHEACLAEIFSMDSDELLARLAIKSYDYPGFIPAEVLVTLARNRYGSSARVRNAIALTLNGRLLIELKAFLNKNLQWYRVMTRSSESEVEAVAYVRERIFRSTVDVSFPEVTFGQFVGTRLLDWFKSEIRLKNKVPSVDAFRPVDDEDGNELSLIEQVVDDVNLSPDGALERKQLIIRCRAAVLRLSDKQRVALSFCVLHEMTHKQAGEIMGLSESSVQKYVKTALAALRSGDWHE
jgi:RNA polymerase sigma factor (sigma-70 family)